MCTYLGVTICQVQGKQKTKISRFTVSFKKDIFLRHKHLVKNINLPFSKIALAKVTRKLAACRKNGVSMCIMHSVEKAEIYSQFFTDLGTLTWKIRE